MVKRGEIEGLTGFQWVKPGSQADEKYGLGLTTRKAYNPLTGELLTVRQAQTRAHQGVAFEKRERATPKREYKMRELSGQDDGLIRDYQKRKKDFEGVEMTREEVWKSKDFQLQRRRLYYKNNSPTSAKAQALMNIGRRDPESNYWVGTTPTEDEMTA